LSALACFDRLNTPLQAAWTYHATDMPCAAFTPVSTHVFASTPTAECRFNFSLMAASGHFRDGGYYADRYELLHNPDDWYWKAAVTFGF